VAVSRAAASLETASPRPHVFVASGSYVEVLYIPDGVQVHGGYRRDFRALDPQGFRVDVRAPADAESPGGAALVGTGAGVRETVVEWVSVRGLDAPAASTPAFGAVLTDPGPLLSLRSMEIRAGSAGAGGPGVHGTPGSGSSEPAGTGDPPRAAVENASRRCFTSSVNEVAGGAGATNRCGTVNVSGGRGGTARCPTFAQFQESGTGGQSSGGLAGGQGGQGGQDSQGPVTGIGCDETVCCGLADYSVPSQFQGPQPGQPGRDGSSGTAGQSCTDPLGTLAGEAWQPGTASGGTAGTSGSGGGGGGAGGGTHIIWYDDQCEYPDGLGGGGGGGGAGGCGGGGGRAGTSGGPSVALVARYTAAAEPFEIREVRLAPGDGGSGGDGGVGGQGGPGGVGAFGGSLPREELVTITLAGPYPGERGGAGGNGGAGGGGGAGCGGGSVGIWVTGAASFPVPGAWRTQNTYDLGRPGVAGRGGGGGEAAPDGAEGGAIDVVVR
jgi:hypothetical protein